jgi:membrane-associated phospholipid phosphatase
MVSRGGLAGAIMKHYGFIDYATQAYIALVAVLLLVGHNQTVPEWSLLVPAHLLGMGLLHLLIHTHARARPRRWLDFLRSYYPVLLYAPFYRETGALNQMFVPDYQDPYFIRLEQSVFGAQPSVLFMDRFPHPLISEVFYAAYFSYYLMIAGVGLALLFRNRAGFFHYVSVTSFVFYLCYLCYIFLPVMGPRVFFREIEGYRLPEAMQDLAGTPSYPAAVRRGPFYQLMGFIYGNFEAPGAAFPSSHVAIAITTLWFSFQYLRSIRYVHLVLVVLLSLATVYCRYHYVVDVLAGALTPALLIPIGDRLYRRFAGPRSG